MRKSFLIVLVLQCGLLSAQDWVLLNPNYRYNYSNDGSDTISNQIRVMHVDTLGVDSFRYEQNLVGVVCDTCPASLGGPCDGCFVRVDQPQFLGYDCIRSGNDWLFNGADTFLIKSSVGVGDSWIFEASTSTTATMDAEYATSVLGNADTLRRILISSGDTLLISRSFGIIRFAYNGERYDLLGVEGAGVGRLFPDPLDYFDYQPGDQLTYHVSAIWGADPPGWFPFPFQVDRYWQVVINGRVDTADTMDYTTSVARTNYNSPYPGLMDAEPNWPMPLAHWSFNRTDVLAQHPILSAYPGQVMDTSICWPEGPQNGTRYLAHYGIAADGRARMFSQALGQSFGVPNSGFDVSQEVAPGVFPFTQQIAINAWYEEGVGIRNVQFRTSYPFDVRVELVGAIIGGDTIIPPPVINWATSIDESSRSMFSVFPNPTADQLTVIGAQAGNTIRIQDIEGRLIRCAKLVSDDDIINVSDLKPGMYFLRVEDSTPIRFVIAR